MSTQTVESKKINRKEDVNKFIFERKTIAERYKMRIFAVQK